MQNGDVMAVLKALGTGAKLPRIVIPDDQFFRSEFHAFNLDLQLKKYANRFFQQASGLYPNMVQPCGRPNIKSQIGVFGV